MLQTESKNVTTEALQKEQYERIAAGYDAHYNDANSVRYLREFVFEPMLAGLDVKGKRVLEAMCGGGQITGYLQELGAHVTGLDLSASQVANYRKRYPGCEVVCASALNTGISDNSYDVIVVIGGFHHLPPHEEEGIAELHRILKPGGYLSFMEPHRESVLDRLRRLWYSRDDLFAENEEAIDTTHLHQVFADKFEFKKEIFAGNTGHLLVYNSMIFRVPLWFKGLYSPFAIFTERILNRILGKTFSCYVVAQWEKK